MEKVHLRSRSRNRTRVAGRNRRGEKNIKFGRWKDFSGKEWVLGKNGARLIDEKRHIIHLERI